MRVHHVNCGTMRPPARRLVNGTGGLFEPGLLVCHCLLVETEQGLVLVDSGFGRADIDDPGTTLGQRFLRRTRPALDPAETAIHQVTKMGYRPQDVRHIVLTHLHVDHVGGISDFPWATVHVHAAEHRAAMHPDTTKLRRHYPPIHWAHNPTWATYEQDAGESWFGFEAVRPLRGLPPEILLVPLLGHSPGHTGVAVNTGTTWLLHAGDAYFCHGETDPVHTRTTPALALFENLVQHDRSLRRRNQARLRQLRAEHGDQIVIFSAHDHTELAPYQAGNRA
jgi:glyoxylase-like metal-dependent hydrolase (beta-lactamase superfamily II)